MSSKQSHGPKHPKSDAAGQPQPKVGSDPEAAKALGGKGDFGVRESDTVGRNYTSENTRRSDPGAAQPHAGDNQDRVSGVGGNNSGPGSGSGGDIDTDFVGVGTGGSGLSVKPAGEPAGPDDSTGTARDFASGPPTRNKKGPKAGKIEGTTVDPEGDIESLAEGRGAQAASRTDRPDPDQIDDSFVGEISTDEAAGQDSR